MARAALRWSLRDLAEKAKVNLNTVARFEAGREVLSSTIRAMEKVLAGEGIVLIEADAFGGLGVRMARDAVDYPPASKNSDASARNKRQQAK